MATIELTLIKKSIYNLEPFGKFSVKFLKRTNNVAPRTIPLNELSMFHDDSMPFSEQQEKDIIKFMKKEKTDILTDGSYNGFYTRLGGGKYGSLVRVYHNKLGMYRDDEGGFKAVIDNNLK